MLKTGQVRANDLAGQLGLSERYIEELLRAATLHGYLAYTPGDIDDSQVLFTVGTVWDRSDQSNVIRSVGSVLLQQKTTAISKRSKCVMFVYCRWAGTVVSPGTWAPSGWRPPWLRYSWTLRVNTTMATSSRYKHHAHCTAVSVL